MAGHNALVRKFKQFNGSPPARTRGRPDDRERSVSSLRAWVAYEGPPVPVTPLFISKTSARLDMRFHIQNVGKSVASSVKLIAELHILADYQSWRKNNSICDRARAERVEVSIIPNTTFFTDRKVAVIPDAEWDEYENMVRRGAGSDSAVLFLDTCIHYADGRNEHQYTRLGFVMLKKVAEKEVPFSTANVETVPADVLSFTPLSDVIRAN